jgi:hypothetical protein
MKKDFHTFSKSIPFLIYIIAAILCFPYFMYQINPDGVCYISIAKNYASGNFHDAINGYWSPLISWILAPFLVLGLNPLITFKVINLIIGICCLFPIKKLIRILIPENRHFVINILIQSSFSLMIVDIALSVITPDLLAALLVLIYLNLIIEKKISKQWLLVALLGALMYFTKAYFFWFFIVHLLTYTIYSNVYFLHNKNIKSFFLIAFLFLIFLTPWEIALYSKYNKIVISLAAKYDHAMMKSGRLVNTYEEQLTGMPNKNAVSAWEDVSLTDKYDDWSGFESIGNFTKQIEITAVYFNDFLVYLLIWPVIAISVVGMMVHIWRRRKHRQKIIDPIFEIFILSLIYFSGYAVFFFEPRYFWGILFINIVVAYYFFYNISLRLSFGKLRSYALFTCVFILINIPPLKEIKGFVINMPGKIESDHSIELKDIIPKGSNVASYSFGEGRYISYYLGLHDFGGICKYSDNEALKSDLEKFSIDFIIMENNESIVIPVNCKFIKTKEFKVYDLRELSN